MSGRHRSYATQQQNTRSSFPTGLVAGGAAVVVVAGVALFAINSKSSGGSANGNATGGGNGGCSGAVTNLNVAAAPDIAQVLSQIATAQSSGCTHITVNSVEPAAVAGFLNGTAKGGGDVTAKPDVWIPDSTLWIDVARTTQAGQQQVPEHGTPVATTPAVVAMPKPIADAQGWPKPLSWKDFLANQTSAHPLQLAVPDPNASGPGLAAITAIRGVTLAAAGGDPAKLTAANTTITAVYRGLAKNVQGNLSTLMTSLPTTEATATSSDGIAAFPATEQKVWKYNSAAPPVKLEAFYPTEGTVMLDYPYLETVGLDDTHHKAAQELLAAFQAPAAASQLTAQGFRDAKGAPGAVITQDNGVDPKMPAAVLPADPTHKAAPDSLKAWGTISQQTHGLLVLDVSGSMGLTVPGQIGPDGRTMTRMQMVAAACIGGIQLFGDNSDLGLWTFTTKVTGGATVHDELVPMGPLGGTVGGISRRTAMLQAFQGLSVQKGSRNGLYDTILDAYKTVQANWAENKNNAVVVFTDGKDDGLNSMTSDALIRQLQDLKAANPTHPVRVLVIALGKGVDLTQLQKITAVAYGKAIYAGSAQDIGVAALEGFASRLG